MKTAHARVALSAGLALAGCRSTRLRRSGRTRRRARCSTPASRRWAASTRSARSRTSRARRPAPPTPRARACSPTRRCSPARSSSRRSRTSPAAGAATLVTQTVRGVLPTKTRTVAIENGFTYNLMSKVSTPMTPTALAGLAERPAPRSRRAAADRARPRGDAAQPRRRHDRRAPPQAHHLLDRRRRAGRARLRRRDRPALARRDARRQRRARRRAHRDGARPTTRTSRSARAASKLPNRVVTQVAGETTQDLKYGKVVVNGGPASGLLDPPTDAETRAGGAAGRRRHAHEAGRRRLLRGRRLAPQPVRGVQGPRGRARGPAQRGALARGAREDRGDGARQAGALRRADPLPLRPQRRAAHLHRSRASRS